MSEQKQSKKATKKQNLYRILALIMAGFMALSALAVGIMYLVQNL